MSTVSSLLFQLQKIDTRNDLIKQEISKLQDLIQSDNRLHLAVGKFEQLEIELANLVERLNEVESVIKQKRLKIEQSESAMYAGSIKNPKELQDLQKEITLIKTSILHLEESQMTLMLEVEEKENESKNGYKLVQDTEGEVNKFAVEAKIKIEHFENELKKIASERDAFLLQIRPDTLTLYNSLRSKKKGVAVCNIEDNCCSGCGAQLTPAEVQSVHISSQLVTCGSCARFLTSG
jgi:uncharacterized protein